MVSVTGLLGLDGRPGTRAPHLWVEYQGKRISTLDLFGKGFVLLTGSEGEVWRKSAAVVAANLGIDLAVYRIGQRVTCSTSRNAGLPALVFLQKGLYWRARMAFSPGVPESCLPIFSTNLSEF